MDRTLNLHVIKSLHEMKREAEEQKTHHMDDFAQQRNRILQEALKSARNRAQTSHGPRAPSEESSASRRKDSSAQEKRTEHAEDKQSGNMPGAGRQRPASANTRYFQDFEQRKYTERREREARQRQQSSRRSAPAQEYQERTWAATWRWEAKSAAVARAAEP